MIFAIHQPNYAPWLGYFYKVAHSDLFVFLDDAQFSVGSYTNRVKIGRSGDSIWLTQPIRKKFGQPICAVEFSNCDWPRRHLDALRGAYCRANAFAEVWPAIQEIWNNVPSNSLAVTNRYIIEELSKLVGIRTRFCVSSDISTDVALGDERLVKIMQIVSPPGSIYLSGAGGSDYQSSETFSKRGHKLEYSTFSHPQYHRSEEKFILGLSILDVLFHLGIDQTEKFVRGG